VDLDELEMIDPALHAHLVGLRARLAFPETPDLAGTVGIALADSVHEWTPSPTQPRPPALANHRSWRRVAVLAAVVALIVAAGLAIPATRETVADWFGVPGIQIVFEDDAPTIAPGGSTADAGTPAARLELLLGEPVTLEVARARAGFQVAVPDLPDLGPPDQVYLRDRPGADQVAFLYRPRPGLPDTAGTGIGLLFVQFKADDDAFWGVKATNSSTVTQVVQIRSVEGLWLGGTHRLLIYPDPGEAVTGTPNTNEPGSRVSGNVLLWASSGVTYRLESSLDLADAVGVAESMRSSGEGTPEP